MDNSRKITQQPSCILICGKTELLNRETLKLNEIRSWQELTIEEHMKLYEEKGIERKECMKKVAKDRGITKREVYDALLDVKN